MKNGRGKRGNVCMVQGLIELLKHENQNDIHGQMREDATANEPEKT